MAKDPAPQVNDPLIGRVLADQYLIESLVARGGMGNIYLARQQRLGKTVAVKVLRPEFCKDERVVKRFLREALAVSQLNHPHTAQVFDSGETPEGVHFIVMEFLEGESLDRRIAREGRLDPSLAVTFVGQTAAALAEAHAKGIVHRDLKPSNIFIVSPHGVPEFIKVLDFGIAKFYSGREDGYEFTKLTAAGSTMGTPHYMAPEQIRGEEVDARADIYSLGVILWEAVTGRPPYVGDSPMEIFLGHLEHKLPKLAHVAPDLRLPQGLEELLRKAMGKKPAERFRSAQEIKNALDLVAMNALPAMNSQRLRVMDMAGYAPAPTEVNRRVIGRKLRVWIGMGSAAVAAIAILSLLLFWLVKDKEPSAPVPSAPAHIKVFSEPAGAEVLVKRKIKGVTPLSIELRPPAVTPIEVRAAGMDSVLADIPASDKEVRGLVVALQAGRNTGEGEEPHMTLWVETDPSGALVSVNGKAMAERTPCRVKLNANGVPAELTLQREGFLVERYVTMTQPGSTLVLNSRLVPR